MPDFSLLIKPASSLCNMRCKYCFYADVSSNRSVPSYGIMSTDTAEALIDRAVTAAGDRGRIHFAFQGGEPTLAGLPFFRSFVRSVEQKLTEGQSVDYSIQTNGLTLDDEFCDFLAEKRFLVGLSLDGDREFHDSCRCDAEGGSYLRVMKAAERMKKHRVEFNILTVLTRKIAEHPKRLWNFCIKNRFGYLQTIPCLPPLENPNPDEAYSLSPRTYGRFLKEFFRIWSEELEKGEYISVRLFDNYVRMAMGEIPEQCGMSGACSAQFVIEADGSVYPCDFYVLDPYRLGKVQDNTFEQMYRSEVMRSFMTEGLHKPEKCVGCRFFGICNGGCRRYRDLFLSEANYCPIADFLGECAPEIKQIANQIQSGKYR